MFLTVDCNSSVSCIISTKSRFINLGYSNMCGVVALFSRDGLISEAPLKAATMSLEHRGPDSQSWWLSENRKVGLAHARLSIIDLESGQQPLSNEDNSIFLVANGELYDFERIRGE